jgi:hypothetical protein
MHHHVRMEGSEMLHKLSHKFSLDKAANKRIIDHLLSIEIS